MVYIPFLLFHKCGGLRFLLCSDYKNNKLPVNLFNFQKQALEAWGIAYKHNFWNNQHILSRNKSTYMKDWINKGLIFVLDVLNDRGNLYKYEDLFRISK